MPEVARLLRMNMAENEYDRGTNTTEDEFE
jgi:hypothetical protein